MGGRGANRNRKNGQIEPKVYYSTGYMDVLHNDTPVKVKMIEADTSKSGGAQGMPSWSNSPNSIYATTDKNKGTVERIRLFDENCKAFADLEYHPIETGGKPKTHWHAIDFILVLLEFFVPRGRVEPWCEAPKAD